MAKETAIPNYPPHISRREFIGLSTAFITAGGLIALGLDKNTGSGIETYYGSLEKTISDIKSRYGISIPMFEGVYIKYQTCLDQKNEFIPCKEQYSTEITLEEAEIIKDSLGMIPSPGKYVQLILPFREEGSDVIGGGSFLGQNWGYFLNSFNYQGYSKDKYLSNFSAVEIGLSNKKPDETLPPVTQTSNFFPTEAGAALNSINLIPTNRVDYPWTTYGERLKQVVIHEIGGHGVEEFATKIKVENNPQVEYKASAMSPFGLIPLDTFSPVTASFAKVNGWKQIPYSEYLTQWGDEGAQQLEELKRDLPKKVDWPVWDRDPEIWGPIRDRNIRLDTLASYGTIKETFATFFMFYALSRKDERYDKSLLTSAEIKYFNTMFRGLSRYPEKYIKQLIADNPGPTYNSELFETKTDIKTPD